MTSRTMTVEVLIHDMIRQYPVYPSTFSRCDCKRDMARGGGPCPSCLEEELAEIIGEDLADQMHQAIKTFATVKREALDAAGA